MAAGATGLHARDTVALLAAEVWRWAVAAALTAVTLCACTIVYALRNERMTARTG